MSPIVEASRIVQSVVVAAWKKDPSLRNARKEDLDAAMRLFAEVAVGKAQGADSVSASADAPAVASKVHDYVKNRFSAFCFSVRKGVAFSHMSGPIATWALARALVHYSSVLAPFVQLSSAKWLSEEELNQQCGEAVAQSGVTEIAQACGELNVAYMKNGELRAGYYLLWFIKKSCSASYDLPPPSQFTQETAAKVLSSFFKTEVASSVSGSKGALSATKAVGIFHYREGLDELLDEEARTIRLVATLDLLRGVPQSAWPEAQSVLMDLLQRVSKQRAIEIAHQLEGSADVSTAQIGGHLFAAMSAPGLTAAIPHLYALRTLLPHLSERQVEALFGYPFPSFRADGHICSRDPDYTRRLQFGKRTVCVYDTIMVGVHSERGSRFPLYLLAYDIDQETLVWGEPLGSVESMRGANDFVLKRVGDALLIAYTGDCRLRLIDAASGRCLPPLELPNALHYRRDTLHMHSLDRVYFTTVEKGVGLLKGGAFANGEWKSHFSHPLPSGTFKALSSHCGFLEEWGGKLVVFGPSGVCKTFGNCLDVQALGDRLVTIERDPDTKDRSALIVRILMEDGVVSDIVMRISLNRKRPSIGGLCQQDKAVLFSTQGPVFVDMSTGAVVYSDFDYACYGERFVDPATAHLWSWDRNSTKIWRVTPDGAQQMGVLDSGYDTSLLHVDAHGHLYFVDIPS